MTSSLAVRFGGPPGRASSGQLRCDEPARSSSPSSLLAGCTTAAAGVSPTPSAGTGLVDIGAGLTGPAGLTATVVATGLAHVSAFAFDADGRLWAATAGYGDDGSDAVYLVASEGAPPVKVIAGLHTPLGLVWSDGTLYVASSGRVDAYRDLAGSTFSTQHDGPGPAVGWRRGQRPGAVTGRSARPGRLGAVRRVRAGVPVRRRRPVVPARRFRPAGRGGPDPRPGRPRVRPDDERPVRHDEPARRPRRRHAR